jgi:hypothetical protein
MNGICKRREKIYFYKYNKEDTLLDMPLWVRRHIYKGHITRFEDHLEVNVFTKWLSRCEDGEYLLEEFGYLAIYNEYQFLTIFEKEATKK